MIAADRYAKSLMQLATETNQVDAVRNDMRAIDQVSKENREFVLLLNSPVVKTDKKISVLDAIFGGKVSDLTMSFLKLVTRKHRESYLGDIAGAFNDLYKRDRNIYTAVVTSAKGLDASTRERLLELIRSQLKGEVELFEKTDPATIGGFVLKIGDRQIDKSVARQLSNLKKQFTNKGLN
jgi:F-type H+-transporting ATPase subunit delta